MGTAPSNGSSQNSTNIITPGNGNSSQSEQDDDKYVQSDTSGTHPTQNPNVSRVEEMERLKRKTIALVATNTYMIESYLENSSEYSQQESQSCGLNNLSSTQVFGLYEL